MSIHTFSTSDTYDDVTMYPKDASDVGSRQAPKLQTELVPGVPLGVPIVPATMEYSSNPVLARVLWERYQIPFLAPRKAAPGLCQEEDLRIQMEWAREFAGHFYAALSVDNKDVALDKARRLAEHGASGFTLQPLNGHSMKLAVVLDALRNEFPNLPLLAGNVVTEKAVRFLHDHGASCAIVGMGPGAPCTTRGRTGFGRGQFTAVLECATVAHDLKMTCCADGGIRGSRELALALAAGADFGMCGQLFARTPEGAFEKRPHPDPEKAKAGVEQALYAGLASKEHQERFGNGVGDRTVPEGAQTWVDIEYKDVHALMDLLLGGVKSAMSMANSLTVAGIRDGVEFERVGIGWQVESAVRS